MIEETTELAVKIERLIDIQGLANNEKEHSDVTLSLIYTNELKIILRG